DLRTLIRLWLLFRRERPQIVHTHSSKAGILGRWAAKLAGVPVIFHTYHGFGFHDFQHPLVRKFYVWIEQLTKKVTTQAVVVSYANAEKAEQTGILHRNEWVLCRAAISVQEFMQPGIRRGR